MWADRWLSQLGKNNAIGIWSETVFSPNIVLSSFQTERGLTLTQEY